VTPKAAYCLVAMVGCMVGASVLILSFVRFRFGRKRFRGYRGRCQVGERLGQFGPRSTWMLRNAFDACDISPHAEGGVANGTICVGGKAMATKLKEIMDAAMGGQKTLCVAG